MNRIGTNLSENQCGRNTEKRRLIVRTDHSVVRSVSDHSVVHSVVRECVILGSMLPAVWDFVKPVGEPLTENLICCYGCLMAQFRTGTSLTGGTHCESRTWQQK